jgi:membrane-associated phospholipid phosphatase
MTGTAPRPGHGRWLSPSAGQGGTAVWAALAAVILLTATGPAWATEPTDEDEALATDGQEPSDHGVAWDPGWPSVGFGEYVVIGTAAASVAITSVMGPVGETRRGGILMDEDMRDLLRLHSSDSRRRAREASDVMLSISFAYPMFIDAVLVAGWHHDRSDTAWNMAIIDLETMAVVASVQRLMNIVIHRERPYGRHCGGDLDETTQDCDTDDRFFSAFSGHASQSFASAALTCSHHMNLPLYGGGPIEGLPCVTGFTLATLVASLRVASDRHYFTDVLVGAAVGTTAGFAIPWLYYGYPRQDDDSGSRSPSWSATLVPTPTGAMIQGAF